MPVLPEEALQKLTCSSCKKYLSVLPVKVFHNKNVLCGRCEDKNVGTTSRLYELVANQFKFPCINRFEGCKGLLLASDVGKHETTCYSDEYPCPLCSDFNGSAYDLLRHMKINHKAAALESTGFLIEMDQGSTSEIYFYCRDDFLTVISYQYDASDHHLTLNLDVFGKERVRQQNIMHSFSLYSVQNKLQYKTGNKQSSDIGFEDNEGGKIDLTRHKYPKNIIVCKFRVWNLAVLLEKYRYNKRHIEIQSDLPPILDKSVNKALLKFTFDKVSTFEKKVVHYSCNYWVGDRIWKLGVERTEVNLTEYLGVHLYQEEYENNVAPCKVIAKFTLNSFKADLTHKFTRKSFESGLGWPDFSRWDNLLDPIFGYVTNDRIEFLISIEVLPEEVPQCAECKKSCPTCKEH